MITVHLTKLEIALDQVRKSYPKLKPADAGLISSALVLTGRHALAIYDGEHFTWPEELERLERAMISQMEMIHSGLETAPKKSAKAAAEEEPVQVTVGLTPNLSAGEALLDGRDDLKALLSEIIREGVEFVYAGTDIGWQWALDRTNWTTVTGLDINRRVKIKATFTEGAVGIETGTTSPKKRAARAAKAAVVEDAVDEIDAKAELGMEDGALSEEMLSDEPHLDGPDDKADEMDEDALVAESGG
jgi:hypothetical protein